MIIFKAETQGWEFVPRLCVFFISGVGHQAPMQEVTPKVVAMAVSTVMTMLRILLQRDLFSMMFDL